MWTLRGVFPRYILSRRRVHFRLSDYDISHQLTRDFRPFFPWRIWLVRETRSCQIVIDDRLGPQWPVSGTEHSNARWQGPFNWHHRSGSLKSLGFAYPKKKEKKRQRENNTWVSSRQHRLQTFTYQTLWGDITRTAGDISAIHSLRMGSHGHRLSMQVMASHP